MKNKNLNNSRRNFLKNTGLLGAISAVAPQLLNAQVNLQVGEGKVGQGFTFLFQGDSITDGNRSRDNDWNHVMGHGYQYIIASKLWYENPKKGLHFFNRGISGDKVTDLARRWQQDTLDVKPNLLSILIGINDASASIGGNKNFTVGNYESGTGRSCSRQNKPCLTFSLFFVTLLLCLSLK